MIGHAASTPRATCAVLVFLVALATTLPRTASAQTVNAEANATFAAYKADVQAGATAEDRADAADPLGNPDPFFWALIDEASRTAVVRLFEDARLSKQLGSGSAGAGTTSIAVRGDSPTVLGLAVEHGLVTGVRSGDTVTFRGNLIGLAEAAANKGFVESFEDDRPFTRALRRFSFGVSFDPSGSDETIDPNADRMSAWSARFDLTSKRDPRDPAYRSEWQTLDATTRREMQAAANEAMALLWSEPAFTQWRTETLQLVAKAAVADLPALLDRRLLLFRNLSRSAATQSAVSIAVQRTLDYLSARRDLVDRIMRAPIVVVEYTSHRPLDAPRSSDVRFVAEAPLLTGRITGNVATVFYDEEPIAGGRVRGFDAALQWDLPLSYRTGAGPVLLTLAGRVQHIRDGIIFENVLVPDSDGYIGVFQMKATVPIRDAGLRIPVSVTWANRSELIKENFVRGQVGLTFDFDALLAGRLSALPLP